ncbi:hypothetical protein HanRHA438_Chr00c58g0859661 [Helianthus annuus]|nr:hypothetical protein HanRHA438_Chr00c58g0859661 [Helianthus annuus]
MCLKSLQLCVFVRGLNQHLVSELVKSVFAVLRVGFEKREEQRVLCEPNMVLSEPCGEEVES